MKLCEFLKTMEDIKEATAFLIANGLPEQKIDCKNWDLARVLPDLRDGDLLDMGSSDSFIVEGAIRRGLQGRKVGVDLRLPTNRIDGVEYLVKDMVNTGLPDNSFTNITSLSVIEHNVDIPKFITEVHRLLIKGGRVYITFDYWDPKVHTGIDFMGAPWTIFCRNEIQGVLQEFARRKIYPVETIDWTIQDGIIKPEYHAPPGFRFWYTFGLLTLEKT